MTLDVQTVGVIALGTAVIGLFILWLRARERNLAETTQQQLEFVRQDMRQGLEATKNDFFQSLRLMSESINQQLGNIGQQLQRTTGQVGERLDNAARVIGEVQRNLGELGKATQEIKELGQSVSKLEEILRAPKLRGGLGELLLEDLLKQVLPVSSFEIQYRFRSGQTVDAVIRTAGGLVPIDSKFPLENFRKFSSAESEADRRVAHRTFVNDVKKHIDRIAASYILPDEGTFNFALMYIPSESIYYETIICDDKFGSEEALYNYALEHKVVPVSPNSFYAHLLVISMGLKGLQIEKSAQSVLRNLNRLSGDLRRFSEDFEVLGRHLTNAKNKYDDSARKLDQFGDRLERVTSQTLGQGEKEALPSPEDTVAERLEK
jgi:DNA recombination protein RmuC